ncbi:MAG: protein-L-isoaspartate(D-aspartate) O-methyltransferase [Deltaproteobacteria bacterium]|nr:protein-L-isoaspartate(D-aspartate) O-methyltransferase [Deltaproteobacteria bacterium]
MPYDWPERRDGPVPDTEVTLWAREQLVRRIERAEHISTRVARAMREVPRHVFVPADLLDRAYEDGPLPIGDGQTISQPTVVALMSDALQLQGNERILEIGTGSGYQAAVLSRLCADVQSLEVVEALADRARAALASVGYDNVQVHLRDGFFGMPELAPFDGVIITAAPAEVPVRLLEQLREGGRMVVPVGPVFGVQHLLVLRKHQGQVERTNLGPVRFVPMVGG